MQTFRMLSAATFLLSVSFGTPYAQTAKRTPAKSPGSVAEVSRLPHLPVGGVKSSIEKHKGKIVVLHVWAGCCAQCSSSVPSLVRLRKQYTRKDVEIVTVVIDLPEGRERVSGVLRQHRSNFTTYRRTPGDDEAFIHLVDDEWNGKLPFTKAYSKNGQQGISKTGAVSFDDLKKLVESSKTPTVAMR